MILYIRYKHLARFGKPSYWRAASRQLQAVAGQVLYGTRCYPEKQTPLFASGRQRLASRDLQLGKLSQELFVCAI